jgi:hypothetical protein
MAVGKAYVRKRDRKRERYYERKAAGQCTGSLTCDAPLVEDRQMCAEHLEKARLSTATSLERTRAERREDGLCAFCGKVKSEEWACLRCKVLRGWLPSSLANVPENVPAENDPSRFKVSRDGRRRYHGQMKRGRQPVSQLDDQDLKAAHDQIKSARDVLAKVNAPAAEAWPRHERESARREALALAEHASRFVDEVLDRHGFAVGGTSRVAASAVDADHGPLRRRGRG